MSVAVGAVCPLLVLHILYDITRVSQREIHLKASHCEQSPQPPWHCGEASCEMGGAFGRAPVVYHVACRHDGESAVHHHGRPEDSLIILLSRGAVVVACAQRVGAIASLAHHSFELAHGELVVKKGIGSVPRVDDPPPRSPSPYGEHRREEVVARHPRRHLVAVEACYHGDALVVLITVEHLLTEREERLRRHIVVLKHYAFVDDGERPFLRYVLRRVAAVVALLVHPADVALPVDVLHHAPACLDAGNVVPTARSVLIEEEPRWSCLPHFIEHFLESFGAVEEQDEYRHIHFCRLFVHCLLPFLMIVRV